jgi:hypothetical protein
MRPIHGATANAENTVPGAGPTRIAVTSYKQAGRAEVRWRTGPLSIGRAMPCTAEIMSNLEHSHEAMPDERLAALVRAIASELLQSGYLPTLQPGRVTLRGPEPRIVAPQIWKAMKEIQAGREV